jgi:bifunctional UDP-N-acetylglucosamine pyrophosphorylase/glucosamine-1-phosphate N-acetyltransferase
LSLCDEKAPILRSCPYDLQVSGGHTVLIMAAGEGTRMRSSRPKVLHEVCGRAMVAWPVAAARAAGAQRVAVIVSPNHDLSAVLPDGTESVVQPEPDGTGGAIRAALDIVRDSETVVVVPGDHPLISGELLASMLAAHDAAGAAGTVMTVQLDEAGSYGRIVRDSTGAVERIVETKHPESVPADILAIREISTSTFAFAAAPLAAAVERLDNDNDAGEYYLGDVLPLLRADGHTVAAYAAPDPAANLGVNTRADLAIAAAEARRRILHTHMLAGVTITDPAATWIDADIEIEADAVIEPGSTLRGATKVGASSVVGPHTTLLDSSLGDNVTVRQSFLDHCDVADGCTIGPFTYLRPGTELADGVKAGAFVEIKNSHVGAGAKVPHLSYIGDADVGARANLGASTITANYDGFRKSRTKIGEGARISVHTSLVAPVGIGDDAYTGAGSVITRDVPAGALGIGRAKQENLEGYAERRAKQAESDETDESDASGGSE